MVQKENSYKINTEIQIRFNDIDGLGHVNNAVYAQYFDQGRMHYFKELNDGVDVDWQEAMLIIASTHVDFMMPIFLNEKIRVRTRVYKLGNKSLKMIQSIVDVETLEEKATCKSIMVGFDINSNSSVVLPDKWRKAIENFENI